MVGQWKYYIWNWGKWLSRMEHKFKSIFLRINNITSIHNRSHQQLTITNYKRHKCSIGNKNVRHVRQGFVRMSIGIFYATIGLVTILQSGFCFRCYSCNSIDDKNCEFNPVKTSYCRFIATGCVKLINDVIEYRYIDATGKEILAKNWDGKDSNWQAIPYVERVITRRCGNNYGRYKVDVGCKKMPFLNNDKPDKEIICYCETELCNGTTKSTTMDTLYLLLVIVTNLYISLI